MSNAKPNRETNASDKNVVDSPTTTKEVTGQPTEKKELAVRVVHLFRVLHKGTDIYVYIPLQLEQEKVVEALEEIVAALMSKKGEPNVLGCLTVALDVGLPETGEEARFAVHTGNFPDAEKSIEVLTTFSALVTRILKNAVWEWSEKEPEGTKPEEETPALRPFVIDSRNN